MTECGHAQCVHKVLRGTRQEGSRLGVRVSERPREGSSAGRGRKVGVLARWGAVGKAVGRDGAGVSGSFCSSHRHRP